MENTKLWIVVKKFIENMATWQRGWGIKKMGDIGSDPDDVLRRPELNGSILWSLLTALHGS